MSTSSGWTAFDTSTPSAGGRRRRETIWQFLERSSEPVAADTRARWDSWLARMPEEPREAFIHRLKLRKDDQVRATLAELVTFVLLDAVYTDIDIEPETGTGSRTDFAVNVPVRTHLEVRRKTPPEALTGDARRRATIADELEKIDSPDFWLDVNAFSGAQVPSMHQVRREVEEWLASLDYDEQLAREQAGQLRLAPVYKASGEGWQVTITAHPRPTAGRGPGQFTVGMQNGGHVHVENADDIEETVRDKLSQHKGLTDPLVVVLDLSSPIIDDFEVAAMLYGPVITTVLDPVTVVTSERNRKHGIWPEPLLEPYRPAAVLVLRGIWLGSQDATADLWLPPGAESPLLPGPWDVLALNSNDEPVIVQAASPPASVVLH
jgi:hypothetical protein